MIRATTQLIAHIGFPTHTFKSPLIYNPYFEEAGIDVAVVPMGCREQHFADVLRAVFALTNICGALITMPHKVIAATLVDEPSLAVRLAGSCNAVRKMSDGRLQGDLFDGEGFVRAFRKNGASVEGARAFVAGAGGVGSAIASSLVANGVRSLMLWDTQRDRADAVASRIRALGSTIDVTTGESDPGDADLVINATPLGMEEHDPMPIDVGLIRQDAWVADVVLAPDVTPFLRAAGARGCRIQPAADMLFEQIPLYLAYFGLPVTTSEHLRRLARVR